MVLTFRYHIPSTVYCIPYIISYLLYIIVHTDLETSETASLWYQAGGLGMLLKETSGSLQSNPQADSSRYSRLPKVGIWGPFKGLAG